MRYSELEIETQRQSPAHMRSEGAALLQRAGYTGRDGELTPLGQRMRAHLAELAQTRAVSEFFALIALPVIQTDEDQSFFQIGSGHQEILQCPTCHYTARREAARSQKEPAARGPLEPLKKVATPDSNTIDSLATFLEVPKAKTAKALMYTRNADAKFVFVVIRGDTQLSEEKLRKAVGEVRAATTAEIVAAGAAPGYASPIGLKSALLVVDDLIPVSTNLVAGANEPGYHFMNTNYGRDYGNGLVTDLAAAQAGDACPNCGGTLATLQAELLADANGYRMANLLEALAECHHDSKGLSWPVPTAPFHVYLLHLPGKELDTLGQAQQLDTTWQNAGISVLLDDRDERAGVKFIDADLIGCPVRATLGERAMKDGMVELKSRMRTDTQLVRFEDAINFIRDLTKTAS